MSIVKRVSRSLSVIGDRLMGNREMSKRHHQEALAYHRDVLSLHHLSPLLGRRYLPWSRWSLQPSSIVAVINEILMHDLKVVVELGSGVSTIILGKLLQERGGRLISIENDEKWEELIRGYVRSEKLEDVVDLVSAPLLPWRSDSHGSFLWYDIGRIEAALGDSRIDMLLVDGPPERTGKLARMPAVLALKDHLADNFVIALDDVDRPDETAIIRKWQELLADRIVELHLRRGERIGFLRRSNGYHSAL